MRAKEDDRDKTTWGFKVSGTPKKRGNYLQSIFFNLQKSGVPKPATGDHHGLVSEIKPEKLDTHRDPTILWPCRNKGVGVISVEVMGARKIEPHLH